MRVNEKGVVGDWEKENPGERLGCLWGLRGHKEAPEMLRRQCGARKCWRDQARSRGGGEGCRILFRPTVSFYRVRILTG